jgi:hypothetical protein
MSTPPPLIAQREAIEYVLKVTEATFLALGKQHGKEDDFKRVVANARAGISTLAWVEKNQDVIRRAVR